MNSQPFFYEIATKSGPITRGWGCTPHKVYCYLLTVLTKNLHSWHTTYLPFEFLGIGINNYFKTVLH